MSPFEILEIPETATPEQIKRAYRRLAAMHHPDRGGDAAAFTRIRKAYEQAMKPRKCPECHGRGHIRVKDGPTSKKVPCPTCWR
jgi:DnaJ-class molecular chaperone